MMVGAATLFVVTDIAKSTEHYRDVLGFTVTFEYGTPTFYVCLCRDEVALHLLSASQTSRLSGNGGIPSQLSPSNRRIRTRTYGGVS
jgi:catechol 2,3-dioxygenase-like lactoylglutathione lyase family enzyme